MAGFASFRYQPRLLCILAKNLEARVSYRTNAHKKARSDPGFFVGENQITDNWVYPCVLHSVGLAALHNVDLVGHR